jgi:hypothetical protein
VHHHRGGDHRGGDAVKATKAWWIGEKAIRVSSIPQHIPTLPDGRLVSTATAWRWTNRGLYGMCIRRFRVGGAFCTTIEELARWQQSITVGGDFNEVDQQRARAGKGQLKHDHFVKMLRDEIDQQRTRAEAAEAEVRELRKQMENKP